jgi:hypothetical protein
MVNEKEEDAKDAIMLINAVISSVRVAMNAPLKRNSNDLLDRYGYRAGQPNSLPVARIPGGDGYNSSRHPAKHDCVLDWVAEQKLMQ